MDRLKELRAGTAVKQGLRCASRVSLGVIFVLALVFETYVMGAEALDEGSMPKKIEPPRKILRLAPTFQVAPFHPFGTPAVAGVGIAAAYEFIITPSFFVGLQLAGRYFPASPWLAQMGYGVTLRHAFLSPESMFRPYLAYGLLMQMVWVQGMPGSGMAHDTHLAVGVDSRWLGVPLFLQAAYDISRLRYFGNPEENLDRIDVQLGWEYRW